MARFRLLLLLVALALPFAGCRSVRLDAGAGGETVTLEPLKHQELFKVRYVREPKEGPLAVEKTTWTFLWWIPVNRPDAGLWLYQAMPEGAVPANVKLRVRTKWWGNLLFWATLGLVKAERVRMTADPVVIEPVRPPAP